MSDVSYSRFHGTLILASSGKNKVSIRLTQIPKSEREKLSNMILEALGKHSSPEILQEARTVLTKWM